MIANDCENFRTLFKHSREMFCVLDGPEHEFEFVNDAHKKVLGFDATGMTVRKAQPESVEIHGILDEVYRTGQPIELFEIPVTLCDRLRYFNLTYSPRKNTQGCTQGILIIGTEVTSQILYKELLRGQKEALELTLNGAPLEQVLHVLENSIESILGPSIKATVITSSDQLRSEKLAAEWAMPILSSCGSELGRIVISPFSSESIHDDDKQIIGLMCSTAALVIERKADIEKRAEAEKALLKSQEQLHMAVNVSGVGFFDWDIPNDSVDFSEQMRKDWGIESKDSSQKTLAQALDLIHPADRDRVRHIVNQTVEEKLPYHIEYRVVRASGEIVWLEVRGQTTHDENNQPKRFFGTSINVTNRKNNEEALRQSEEQFRLFAEVAPQMPFITDANGHVFYFNQRWFDYIGHGAGSTLGWDWIHSKAFHPDDLVHTLKAWNASLASGEPFEAEHRLRRHDGEYRWHLARALPIHDDDGTIKFWYGTNVEIHDHKVLTNELSMAISAASLGFWEYTFSNDLLIWSEHLRVHCGFDIGKYEGALEEFFARIHPDDRQRVTNSFSLAKDSKDNANFHLEFRVIPRTGELTWLECQGKILHDEAGQVAKIMGTALDVSRRKNATEALRKAKDAAEKANDIKSAFLANMSHEIRTPLSAILGFTELLKEDSHSKEDRERYLTTITRNGHALMALIDDILDISKVEAGKLELETIEFPFKKLVEEVLSLFQEKARDCGIYLNLDFSPTVPDSLVSDPTRIRQILVNIIGNAIKFTKEGGVEVRVCVDRLDDDNMQLEVLVKDTGVGLSPGQLENLFQPFTQADSTTTRRFGGSGLGLALSQRLANALGGEIYVDKNHVGKGCTFVINFHAKKTKQASFPPTSIRLASNEKAQALRLSNVNILLAEDALDNQLLVKTILTNHGATVDIANDGGEAIEKAMANHYDIVLMDLQMPGVDGYQATRNLRSFGYKKPIVALTAHAMIEERLKTSAAGCDGHLTKPLDLDELISTVDRFGHGHFDLAKSATHLQ